MEPKNVIKVGKSEQQGCMEFKGKSAGVSGMEALVNMVMQMVDVKKVEEVSSGKKESSSSKDEGIVVERSEVMAVKSYAWTAKNGLTLYDLHRTPSLPTKNPNDTKRMEMRELTPFFSCPVCLNVLRETQTVKGCLHRFCKECITKSIRYHKQECPSCRIYIPSKRSLRADHHFDAMIRLMYPDLEDFEAKQEKVIAEIYHSHQVRTKRNVEEMEEEEYGEEYKAKSSPRRRRHKQRKMYKKVLPPLPDNLKDSVEFLHITLKERGQERVEKYMVVNVAATVEQVCNYLHHAKPSIGAFFEYEGKMVHLPLDPHWKLQAVRDSVFPGKDSIVLHFEKK